MEKFFNTAGPVIPEDHYYIPSRERMDWENLHLLIQRKSYFLLHAPRQTGKTSALLELMNELNQKAVYKALYVNIEAAQAIRHDVGKGIRIVCEAVAARALDYGVEPELTPICRKITREEAPEGMLTKLLSEWSRFSKKPVVLFLDEVDALIGDTLISLLRQIRAGYAQRPGAFPQSIIMCGVRDIKDYRIHASSGDIIAGGSAFNIKTESLRLKDFSKSETRHLWQQHTDATGQVFEKEILQELWEDTGGQPWLVNALAHELTWNTKENRNRSNPITLDQYWSARERLIESRATHLDQLADKLREPRVRRCIEPLLEGSERQVDYRNEDLSYTEDLGLIIRTPEVRISNRIYKEIIPRELTAGAQAGIHQDRAWYLTRAHQLDMPKLLIAFQQFFRENSASWLERFGYKEAGPQLIMQAFLQRIVNGGGRISREYALGRRRTDLLIQWPMDQKNGFIGEVQRIVIELKIQRNPIGSGLKEALEQTTDYADTVNADEAYLVYFNRDPSMAWDDKIKHWNEIYRNRTIGVFTC